MINQRMEKLKTGGPFQRRFNKLKFELIDSECSSQLISVIIIIQSKLSVRDDYKKASSVELWQQHSCTFIFKNITAAARGKNQCNTITFSSVCCIHSSFSRRLSAGFFDYIYLFSCNLMETECWW